MAQKPSMTKVRQEMEGMLRTLRLAKPDERNELARRYAVTITEMEKVYAYFTTFIYDGEFAEDSPEKA